MADIAGTLTAAAALLPPGPVHPAVEAGIRNYIHLACKMASRPAWRNCETIQALSAALQLTAGKGSRAAPSPDAWLMAFARFLICSQLDLKLHLHTRPSAKWPALTVEDTVKLAKGERSCRRASGAVLPVPCQRPGQAA